MIPLVNLSTRHSPGNVKWEGYEDTGLVPNWPRLIKEKPYFPCVVGDFHLLSTSHKQGSKAQTASVNISHLMVMKRVSPLNVSHSVTSYSVRPCGLWPARLLCPWDSPRKNTGAGCHALLQGVFPTQRSNLGLPHCRQILYHLNH